VAVTLSLLFVLVGILLLSRGADWLVDGSAGLAEHLGVSPLVIGVVIIGVGTSAPEILVSALAALGGDIDTGIGNAAGSNLTNLTLLLGVAGFLGSATAAAATVRRELPIMVAAVLLLVVAVLVGTVLAGVVAVLAGVGALWWLVDHHARRRKRVPDDEDARLKADVEVVVAAAVPPGASLPRLAVLVLVGLVALVGGGQLLLMGALDLADRVGISSGAVGATLVALGTSLPELFTIFEASRRGAHDLIVGNLLGSNIVNSTIAGGAALAIGGGYAVSAGMGLVLAIMSAGCLLGAVALGTGLRVRRAEAVVLVAAWAAAQPVLLMI
jgi:cation:H+ antiporter